MVLEEIQILILNKLSDDENKQKTQTFVIFPSIYFLIYSIGDSDGCQFVSKCWRSNCIFRFTIVSIYAAFNIFVSNVCTI